MQDVILRGGQALPLYSRVVEAAAPRAIVLPAAGGQLQVLRLPGRQHWHFMARSEGLNPQQHVLWRSLQVDLRVGDVSWQQFLPSVPPPAALQAHVADAGDAANILFSSGTTGGNCPCW